MNQWPTYSLEAQAAVCDRIGKQGSLASYRSNREWGVGPRIGTEVEKFEREAERYFKIKHVVACNSGTMALQAAIYALNLPPGSDIVTTPYSFSATPAAIVLSGHRPVFADVDPYTYCISEETVANVITRKTRAILPVSLFGWAVDSKDFNRFGLPVITDDAQAVGSRIEGVYASSRSTIATWSFNGCKNLPTGEGGAAVTQDRKLAERMRLFISHGENFDSPDVGMNGRMHELVAILARHGLKTLASRNVRRRRLARIFASELDGKYSRFLYANAPYFSRRNVFYVYAFDYHGKPRKNFIRRCARRNVTIGAGYICPSLEKYPAFRRYCTKPLPEVTRLSEETLCIISDLNPSCTDERAKYIARVVREEA